MSKYEFVENQMYRVQAVDQGFSTTKNGDLIFKIFARILGKVTDFVEPDKNLEPIPGAPEVEIRFNLYGNEDFVKFRLRDLKGMGWDSEDVLSLDPARENHTSFVGKKYLVTPSWGTRDPQTQDPYWNVKAPTKNGNRKFVNDVSAETLAQKASGLAGMISRMNEKKSRASEAELVGAGEQAIPF